MQARRRAVPSVRQGLADGRRGRRQALVQVAGGAMPLERGLPPRFGARACSRAGIGLWVVTLKGVVVRAVGGCYDERDWVIVLCQMVAPGHVHAALGMPVRGQHVCRVEACTWNLSQPCSTMYSVAR